MQFNIQVVVDEENGETITEELFALDKSCDGDGLVDQNNMSGITTTGKRILKSFLLNLFPKPKCPSDWVLS